MLKDSFCIDLPHVVSDVYSSGGVPTCKAVIRLNTSSLILISTSNSDSFLSASVLAVRTSLEGQTYWGKSRAWSDATGQDKHKRHHECYYDLCNIGNHMKRNSLEK